MANDRHVNIRHAIDMAQSIGANSSRLYDLYETLPSPEDADEYEIISREINEVMKQLECASRSMLYYLSEASGSVEPESGINLMAVTE